MKTRLADPPVGIRLKLSALWAAVMFCYLYGDFFGLFKPGKLADMMAGLTPVGPTTQARLLAFSLVMAIPGAMVFLSLVLRPGLCRWVNIILGLIYSVIIVLTMPGAWGFYLFLGCVEVTLTGAIAWYAWTWPSQA
jgi:Family of unknown function (DUF6326)